MFDFLRASLCLPLVVLRIGPQYANLLNKILRMNVNIHHTRVYTYHNTKKNDIIFR